MILKRKDRRLSRMTAILLSLGMIVGTTGTNLKVAHAEVSEQLEEQMKEQMPVEEGTADQEGDQEADQEGDQETDQAVEQEKEQETEQEQEKPEDNDQENDAGDDDDFDDDGLIFITEFEKPEVLVYEFDEKPELDTLLKSFPRTLEVTIEKEVLVASVSDASEIMTEDIDVFWECDDDYEGSDLDEYIFYPVPDLIGCEVAADQVPEISVILTDTEKETELKSEIRDIRNHSETIELTANVDGMEVTVSA